MIEITFVQEDGSSNTVKAQYGTLMEAGRSHGVPNIDAECGGSCACATCLVHVDPQWAEAVGPASASEAMLLEYAEFVQPNSRLSCQVELSDALDGIVLHVPRRS
jgi:2Fe-2S ferredoxin